jgi:uncharacterized membrane protein
VRELSQRVAQLERLSFRSSAVRQEMQRRDRAGFEARLGSQYLNRAGIIALLVGISFAVHWAFSNNLLGSAAVLALGIAGGIAIIVVGQWFVKRGYSGFGLSLEALGIAALYVVLWAGFQVFQIIAAPAAFAGMVAVTAATAASAVFQRSELLAIFAFLGGFATPLLLQTERNRTVAVLIYLLVVSCGMAITVAYRRWGGLLIVSFYACLVASGAWVLSTTQNQAGSVPLMSALYIVFIATSFLINRDRAAVAAVVPAASAAYLQFIAITLTATQTGLLEIAAAVALLLVASKAGERGPIYCSVAIGCFTFGLAAELGWQWQSSVAWIALSVVVLLVGFRHRLAFVRWAGLVLITAATLKIFIFDLSRLAAIDRVLALTFLGVVLLGMSFVYQRSWLRQRPR